MDFLSACLVAFLDRLGGQDSRRRAFFRSGWQPSGDGYPLGPAKVLRARPRMLPELHAGRTAIPNDADVGLDEPACEHLRGAEMGAERLQLPQPAA